MIPFGFAEYASMGWRINFTCCLFLSNEVRLIGCMKFASGALGNAQGVWDLGFSLSTKGLSVHIYNWILKTIDMAF
jgi:hypothetical protein